jgi:hypothetical protein
MDTKKNFSEMRKYRRHRTNGSALVAFFTPTHEFLSLGQVLDISLGGLAVQYIALDEQTKGSTHLEIFGTVYSNIHIRKLRCKVIYDIELTSESSGMLKMRRCGLKFGDLDKSQVAEIKSFIEIFGLSENKLVPTNSNLGRQITSAS